MRIYLAGPEVFLADADAVAAAKRAVCAAHGAEGVFPTDPHPAAGGGAGPAGRAGAMHLYERNEAHIRGCDALIANLTPFRGPSADPGTAYEVGFMRALGRPVFGYANVARGGASGGIGGGGFAARSLAFLGPAGARRRAGAWEDAEGMLVEDFGLFDNLMLDCGIAASGGVLVVAEVPAELRWRDLGGFKRCVVAATAALREAGR